MPLPPRGAGPAAPTIRHPAASHPGFDPEELPTGAGNPGTAQVLATMNAGFQRVHDVIALDRDIASAKGDITRLTHSLELERMQRLAAQERFEARLKDLESDVEDTGQHRKKDMEDEINRLRGSQTHWVRYVIGVLVGAVVALLIGTLTRLIH